MGCCAERLTLSFVTNHGKLVLFIICASKKELSYKWTHAWIFLPRLALLLAPINYSARIVRACEQTRPDVIFVKIDRDPSSPRQDRWSRCYGKFPKTFGRELAIGNDECYARRNGARCLNEVVKSSRLLSAGTWGHPRYRQLRERGLH